MTAREGAPSSERIAREAARVTVGHVGPTADRMQSAVLRYLSVAATDEHDESDTTSRRAPGAVRDVMTPDVVTAQEQTPFKEIVALLARNRISAVPVVDADRRVVGVVSESDLLARVSPGHASLPPGHHRHAAGETERKIAGKVARDLMTTPAVFVTPDTSIQDAAGLAGRTRVRWLPVVDADGVLCGAVTRADLLRVFLRPDADIQREIVTRVLRGHRDLPAGAVTVEVHDGVVTLLGELEFASQKRRIVTEVHAISGVVDVENVIRARIDDRVRSSIILRR